MESSISDRSFIEIFETIIERPIDEYESKNLNLFMLRVESNDFAYSDLIDKLVDLVIDFALCRKTKSELGNRHGKLSKEARQKFRKLSENKGELGELLIYCFLESHLKAPKLLSKYELKTSPNDYVKGSDGVHFLKINDSEYQIIFCESKTYKNIGDAISDAFKSIKEFKDGKNEKGNDKPGLMIERSLISEQLVKETFSDDELHFMKGLLYPSRNINIDVDNAFAIFIGYEMKITEEEKKLPNRIFRNKLRKKIKEYVEKYIEKIKDNINKCNLNGYNIYIYILPFTNIEKTRGEIIKEVIG